MHIDMSGHHLEITPASKNHFANPVRLQFDLPPNADPRVMVIYWYDETNGAWVTIPTTYDPATRKVWSDLPHFSMYKADCEVQGRAGW